AAVGSGASTSAASGAGATGSGSGAGGADAGGDEGGGDEGGCSYRAVGSNAPAPAALAGLLVALAFARRRERR
ncbi:MAG TPA: concanavalin A-like lectin/glucanase-domain-containing protein, partial [Sorangium sp.]|nr:concanavalin A-like lectin/glucanase-domain-containing protein [Sorangium sp.]